MWSLPTYTMLKHTFQCYIVLLITYGLARADYQSLPLEFDTCPPSSVSIPALYENITVGTVLARFRNIANFTINTEDYFRVEKNGTGFYLKIKHPLDYETKSTIFVDFHCKAKTEDSFLDYNHEIITINDVLETAPQFNQRKYNISVDENMAVGKELQLEIYVTVENIAGESPNLTISGTDVFEISKVTQAGISQRGRRYKVGIVLKRALDYDKGPPHTVSFTLNATIKDHPEFANSVFIEVDIKDVDDQNPEFTLKTYNCSTYEESTSFKWASEKPLAHDLDTSINETIGYDLIGGDGGHLKIDNNTGSLTIIIPFDREKKDFYAVTLLAYQIDQPLFRRDVTILYITVLDVNDHPPVMAKPRYTASIAENTPNGTVIISLGASDLDKGSNSMFIFKMEGAHAALGLNEESGQIFVQNSEKLDYETTHIINLTVFAQENLTQKHKNSTSANVVIRLTDENDNNPIFSQPKGYDVSCNKTKKVGDALLQVNASDIDDNENGLITFQLKGDSKFRIDSKTGIIFLNQTLDKNFKHEYFLEVTATDNAVIQAARRKTSTIVTVHVKDVNIHSPMFTFPKANCTIPLTEAFTPGLVFELKAHDDDPDDNLTFTMNTNDFFSITRDGTLLLNKMMDREKQEFIPITVSVTDGLHKAVLKLKINVRDVNDNAPFFTTAEYRFSAVEENKTNAFVGQVKALDRDSGINSDVTYQVIGQWRDNFTITENGTLFTRGRLDRENLGDDGVIYLTVLAKDHGIPSMNNTVTVQVTVEDVNDHIPIFTSHSKTFYLDEGYYNIFKPFYTASATDRDVNGIILYAIKEDRHNAFRINNITGALYITKQLNISNSDDCSVAVVIEAYNSKPYVINGDNDTMLVEVEIQDTNNHAPIFRGSPYQFSIKESEKMGYILGTMNATDLDTEYINNHVIYEITNGNEDGKFYMDREKGYIILIGKVDFEKKNQYILTISARNCVPLYNKSPSAVYDTVAINIIKDHWSHTNKKFPTSTPAPASLGPGRSDIACEADSITSFVPVDQLPVGTQLTWRDPACGLTSNGTHLLSTIGHNQCGTTVKITQNSVEFENELIAQSTKSTQSLVDFGDSSFVIPVKCIYPRQTQVATFYQPTQQHVRFYEKRYGHFDVDIVQYKTDKFVTPVQDLGIPRKVPIKSQIYVEAGINDQYSSGLGIHVDQCIATRTPSPSDSVYYSLIKDGCPIIPHVTLYNSTNSKVRFGVEAFRFVTANASDVVYIHCQVSVCDAATPHCAVNCMTSAGRRRRAAAGSGDKTHLLSTGPFMLVVDDQATSLSSSNLVAAISALVAVIACIVAIIGWTRRRHEAVTQPNKL